MESSVIITQGQLEWAAKRGMSECEFFLLPFIKKQFENLSNEERFKLRNLLTYPDPVLYEWLTGISEPTAEDEQFKVLIKKIQKLR